jgi:hypothetical protein
MKTTLAASVLCAAALLIGCSTTPKQAEVSPGAVDGSKASCQTTKDCSKSCSKTAACPSAAKKAEETASPGAVGDTKAKSCCPKGKADAPKQCPSMKAKEDATVSPGALGRNPCCPPNPVCPPTKDCPPCPPDHCK